MKAKKQTSVRIHTDAEEQPKKIFNFIDRTSSGELPNDVALQLIKHYKYREGHDPEDSGEKEGKSKCIWFSIEELEAICKKVRGTSGGDGVRFYFARYTNDEKFKDVPTRQGKENYKEKRTLVLITTIRVTGKISKDDIDQEEVKAAFNKELNLDALAAYNHGELCPNNCKRTTKIPTQ